MDTRFEFSVNKYGFYAVPKDFSGRVVPEVLARGNVYEPRTLSLIRRLAGNGDIISGGAFVGDFFPAISEALVPNAKLWSFEPNPLSFEAATRTIELNKLKNVMLANKAVGAKPDKLFLQTELPNGVIAAARARIVGQPGAGKTIEVSVVPLDELIPEDRHISVLHLDIEGHEAAALRGASRILNQSRPVVVLEAPKPPQLEAFLNLLNDLAPEALYFLAGTMERNAFYLPGQDKG